MPYYDHDKDYPFAAFITNLGKYNEGELVGPATCRSDANSSAGGWAR